jgi:hypothetical protein
VCNAAVKWSKEKQQYRDFCSNKCVGKSVVTKEKREHTNVQTLGVPYPAQSPAVAKKYKHTMLKRYGVPHTNMTHITPETWKVLENKDTLSHLVTQYSTHQLADHLGVSQSLISKQCKKLEIPLIKNSSFFEDNVYDFLEQIIDKKYTMLKNDRTTLNGLELDILIPDLKLAIECNGIYWHSELMGKKQNYHLNKTQTCASNGVRLIHINEDEWVYKEQLVKSRLLHILKKTQRKLHARKCVVSAIDSRVCYQFCEDNHIQGGVYGKINYGLFQGGELVAVMNFGTPRFGKKYQYELLRACNKINTTVVGGASKLFSVFIKQHYPQSVITYSNKRWNTGNLYNMLGFKFKHSSTPNYHYFAAGGITLQSRNKYQKHKLRDMLESFDPLKTEWNNMISNGFNRIWDCGNDVYVWNHL